MSADRIASGLLDVERKTTRRVLHSRLRARLLDPKNSEGRHNRDYRYCDHHLDDAEAMFPAPAA